MQILPGHDAFLSGSQEGNRREQNCHSDCLAWPSKLARSVQESVSHEVALLVLVVSILKA